MRVSVSRGCRWLENIKSGSSTRAFKQTIVLIASKVGSHLVDGSFQLTGGLEWLSRNTFCHCEESGAFERPKYRYLSHSQTRSSMSR